MSEQDKYIPDPLSCCRPVDIHPRCETCKRRKKPVGRSAPYSDLCTDDCAGYRKFPWPVCYWPHEENSPFVSKIIEDREAWKKLAMDKMILETEKIDKLYLEISQLKRATTSKELSLKQKIKDLELRFKAAREGWILSILNREKEMKMTRALAEKWVDDTIKAEVKRIKEEQI